MPTPASYSSLPDPSEFSERYDNDRLSNEVPQQSQYLGPTPIPAIVRSRSPLERLQFWKRAKGQGNNFRHTLGIGLLLVTVVLWTASNFLASVSSNAYYSGYKELDNRNIRCKGER
jgi:hypothetical protein